MNAHFTRSIAIALALTIGAAGASTAFAAVRGGNPGGHLGPSAGNPGNPSHNTNAAIILEDVQPNCDGEIRCINPPLKPLKKLIVGLHRNCDHDRLYWDGSIYKDCRDRDLDY